MILAIVDLHLHSTLNIKSVQHGCMEISHVITILLVIIIEKWSLPVIKSGGKSKQKKLILMVHRSAHINIRGNMVCNAC